MLWLAIDLPLLPLELHACAPAALAQRGPRVVFQAAAGAQGAQSAQSTVVLQADEAAQAMGISAGMSLPTARARCAQLQVCMHDARQQAQCVQQLALSLLRFTPTLVLQPQGVLMEVQGSLRLFGGAARLCAQIEQAVAQFGLQASLAAAPTLKAAHLLALVGGQAWPGQVLRTRHLTQARAWLDALPLPAVLQVLDHSRALQELLQGLGLQTLADLRHLPRAGVQRRGARELLHQLDQAYGLEPDPPQLMQPPQVFEQGVELPERSDHLPLILWSLQRPLQALEGWLRARHLCAAALRLSLRHDTTRTEVHPDTPLELQLAEPESQPSRLMRLLQERLSRLPLPAPVVSLRLQLLRHTPQMLRPHSLFNSHEALAPGPSTEPGAYKRLLDQLQSRIGIERVRVLTLNDDHRPEQAARAQPAMQAESLSKGLSWPATGFGLGSGPPRPVWLLPQPLALQEQQGQPVQQGQPLILRTRAERIESGWFDGQPVQRDYHVAQGGTDHRLRWIFRERQGTHSGWYLHGWFN